MFNQSPALLPPISKRLTAVTNVVQFEPYYPWLPTVVAMQILRTVLALANRTSTFEARLGIQTALTDPDMDAQDPVAPTDASNAYRTAVGRYLIAFDPTGTSDGNIDAFMYWRIGVIYQATSAGVAQGDVTLIPSYR